MRADDIRLLVDYSYAATGRVLDAAARLTPEQFTGPPLIRGANSPRDILVHVLDAESSWRERLRTGGQSDAPDLDPTDFPDPPALSRAWSTDEGQMRAWLATLDDDAVLAPVHRNRPLWQYLVHVVNHGTQHRAETAMILTHWGQSPGDLDLSFYLRGWSDD